MQNYPTNSPEAMAQLLTALMAADDRIDDAEVEALGMLDAYSRIGIKPPAFADVLRDYFNDTDSGNGVERIGGRITDPRLRVLLWDMMVGLAAADEEVNAPEMDFLQRIAALWWKGALPSQLSMPGGRRSPALPQSIMHALERRPGGQGRALAR